MYQNSCDLKKKRCRKCLEIIHEFLGIATLRTFLSGLTSSLLASEDECRSKYTLQLNDRS